MIVPTGQFHFPKRMESYDTAAESDSNPEAEEAEEEATVTDPSGFIFCSPFSMAGRIALLVSESVVFVDNFFPDTS